MAYDLCLIWVRWPAKLASPFPEPRFSRILSGSEPKMVALFCLQNAFAIVTCLDLSCLVEPRWFTECSVQAGPGEGPLSPELPGRCPFVDLAKVLVSKLCAVSPQMRNNTCSWNIKRVWKCIFQKYLTFCFPAITTVNILNLLIDFKKCTYTI